MIQQSSLDKYRSQLFGDPKIQPSAHIVLGSGFGQALSGLSTGSWIQKNEISFGAVPGLSHSTVMDHPGKFRLYQHEKSKKYVVFQMGRIHGYEGHTPQEVVTPVLLSRFSGCENFVLTNAAGGLDLKMNPGEVMVIKDQVNMTGENPLHGPNPKGPDGQEYGPRFLDMGNCYHPQWRDKLKAILTKEKFKHHEGIYLGLMGPTFETHAEVRLFSSWGMGSVGMSTVWETIALRHSGAKVAGLSMISNMGAGLVEQSLDHHDIVNTTRQSAAQIIKCVSLFLEEEIL